MSMRVVAFVGALLSGIVWVAALSLILPAGTDSLAADLLLDRNTESFPYPFTIQNLMWLVFFIGAGELAVRLVAGHGELAQLDKRLLPEDHETVLRRQDVGSIYRAIRASDAGGRFWLQRLLARAILAFQSSGSIEQVNAVFNSTLELYQHETELRYNLLRYLVWLIPTLGFIGTVVGIAFALESVPAHFEGGALDLGSAGPDMMRDLTAKLGVAFYTTLLALLQSALLMFAMHLIQGREEGALNRVGEYCLDNLINRLYEKR